MLEIPAYNGGSSTDRRERASVGYLPTNNAHTSRQGPHPGLLTHYPLPKSKLRIGPYMLLQTLGEGEFGKVKLGCHENGLEEVAVKLIRRAAVSQSQEQTQQRTEKVKREIQVLKMVRHAHIVRLYDVIETEKYIGIVLEYASGGELFDHILAHRHLKEKDAARLFAQLISGVQYMHAKGIVHRDLKLENLLLDRNKNVVITDFGFANRFHSDNDLMATSCGSPCYAAPELVVQDGKYVGTAVDVWSCGVILYAMLAGYLPYDDDPNNPDGDNISLLYKYIISSPLTFPDWISEIPRHLLRIILVPDPVKRATISHISKHPFLAPYASIFDASVEQLEHEASRQELAKREALLAQKKFLDQQALLTSRLDSSRVDALRADTVAAKHRSAVPTTSRHEPILPTPPTSPPIQPLNVFPLPPSSHSNSAYVNHTQHSTNAHQTPPSHASEAERQRKAAHRATLQVEYEPHHSSRHNRPSAHTSPLKNTTTSQRPSSPLNPQSHYPSSANSQPATSKANHASSIVVPVSTSPPKLAQQVQPPQPPQLPTLPVNPTQTSTQQRPAAQPSKPTVQTTETASVIPKPSESNDVKQEFPKIQPAVPQPPPKTAVPLTTAAVPAPLPSSTAQGRRPSVSSASTTNSARHRKGLSISTDRFSLRSFLGDRSNRVQNSEKLASPDRAEKVESPVNDSRPVNGNGDVAQEAETKGRRQKALSLQPFRPSASKAVSGIDAARVASDSRVGRENSTAETNVPSASSSGTVNGTRPTTKQERRSSVFGRPSLQSQISNNSGTSSGFVARMRTSSKASRPVLDDYEHGYTPSGKAKAVMDWFRRKGPRGVDGVPFTPDFGVHLGQGQSQGSGSLGPASGSTAESHRAGNGGVSGSATISTGSRTNSQAANTPSVVITNPNMENRTSVTPGAVTSQEKTGTLAATPAATSTTPVSTFSDSRLRLHTGALDKKALTTKSPMVVIQQVRNALWAMGIEVVQDGDFKIRCTRRGRKKGSNLDVTGTSGFKSLFSSKRYSATGIQSQSTEDDLTLSHHDHDISPSPESSRAATAPPSPLYGDSTTTDSGDEVRFTCEITKIRALEGLYYLDVKRVKGTLWSYKWVYGELVGRVGLGDGM